MLNGVGKSDKYMRHGFKERIGFKQYIKKCFPISVSFI